MKLLIENWREYLREEQGSSVIAHLVGQAGSGKTYFIDNTLLKKYPEIVAQDLDDFDDEADAVVASKAGDKSWRMDLDENNHVKDQKLARKHFEAVQNLVNQFISANSDKKIFLAGMSVFPWVQGNNELNLGNPQMKIYLDIDPQKAAERRIKRDVDKGLYRGRPAPSQEGFEKELEWAAEEKTKLLSAGYKAATEDEIIKAVGAIMQGEPDETPT
jgi:uridine kinase